MQCACVQLVFGLLALFKSLKLARFTGVGTEGVAVLLYRMPTWREPWSFLRSHFRCAQ